MDQDLGDLRAGFANDLRHYSEQITLFVTVLTSVQSN